MFRNLLRLQSSVFYLKSKKYLHSSSANLKSFSKWYRNLWVPQTVEPPYGHVTQIGDPILRQKADAVPTEYVTSEEIAFLIDRMVEVLRKYECVGLAAPQVGISLQIIVMEFKEKLRDRFSPAEYKTKRMEVLPLTVLINPTMKVTSFNKTKFLESCESVKGYSGEVERFEEILLTGLSKDGKEQNIQLRGWNARIAQHELDHINGKLYTDIMDRSTFTCSCWQAVNARAGRVEIPFCPK